MAIRFCTLNFTWHGSILIFFLVLSSLGSKRVGKKTYRRESILLLSQEVLFMSSFVCTKIQNIVNKGLNLNYRYLHFKTHNKCHKCASKFAHLVMRWIFRNKVSLNLKYLCVNVKKLDLVRQRIALLQWRKMLFNFGLLRYVCLL